MLKRVTAFLLAFVLIFCMGYSSVTAEPLAEGETVESSAALDGYTKVSESESLALYADMESGYFYIEDLANHNRWYSVPNDSTKDKITKGITKMHITSQIRVHYMVTNGKVIIGNENVEASSSGSLFKGGVSVKQIDNGIRVEYKFPSIKSTIPVEYVLADDKFEASIITKDIVENKEFEITDIELLPTFGAGNWEEKGSLFVPDGSGALINFNNGSIYNTYESLVYGEELSVRKDSEKTDTQAVRMPVFATLKEKNALMGVVTEGDGAASVLATVGNDRCGYNFVSAGLTYKTLAYDTMLSNNANTEQTMYRTSKKYSLPEFTVRYYFLTGENSDYVKVAEKYREYLMNEKGLSAKEDKPQFNVDIYGAVETKGNFLGITYRKTEALTRYEDVSKITAALNKTGIQDVSARLIGWGKDGTVNYSQLKKVTFSGTLGGKKDFKDMVADLKKSETELVFDADLIGFRKSNRKAETKTLFKKTAYIYEYLRSVYSVDLRQPAVRLLSPARFGKNSEKYLKSCIKNGIENVSLSTLTNLAYSDFNVKNTVGRYEFGTKAEQVLKSFNEKGISISGESANIYAVPYLNRIYSAPTETSAYKLFDKEIPFYQIVLHGIVPMTVKPSQQAYDSKINFLKAVETGNELLFNGMYEEADMVADTIEADIYSSTYKYWIDKATEYYKEYQPLLQKIYNSTITEHKELKTNVMLTSYSNGVKVIVNYSGDAVDIDGTTIEAYSFAEIS